MMLTKSMAARVAGRGLFLRPLLGAILMAVAFSAGAALAAPTVPDTVSWEEGIEYSTPEGESLKLNLARPKSGKGPFPAVICIHGGGFRAGTHDGYDQLCVRLAERGYVAATISYRLAPKHRFPAAVHDTKAAVRWLRAHAADYSVDPARIGVTGGSAGGHLAQCGAHLRSHSPRQPQCQCQRLFVFARRKKPRPCAGGA